MSETKHFAGAYTVRFQLTIDEFLRNESPRRSHRPDYIVVHYDERIVAYIPVKPFFSAKYKKRGDAVRLERSVDAVFVESDAMSDIVNCKAVASWKIRDRCGEAIPLTLRQLVPVPVPGQTRQRQFAEFSSEAQGDMVSIMSHGGPHHSPLHWYAVRANAWYRLKLDTLYSEDRPKTISIRYALAVGDATHHTRVRKRKRGDKSVSGLRFGTSPEIELCVKSVCTETEPVELCKWVEPKKAASNRTLSGPPAPELLTSLTPLPWQHSQPSTPPPPPLSFVPTFNCPTVPDPDGSKSNVIPPFCPAFSWIHAYGLRPPPRNGDCDGGERYTTADANVSNYASKTERSHHRNKNRSAPLNVQASHEDLLPIATSLIALATAAT